MATYFIRQGTFAPQGPFEEARIAGYIAQGKVRAGMEISPDGQRWMPVEEHRLFASAPRPSVPLAQAEPVEEIEAVEVISGVPVEPAAAASFACPVCAEPIQADAKKCRHCGEWLSRAAQRRSIRTDVGADRSIPKASNASSGLAALALIVALALGSWLTFDISAQAHTATTNVDLSGSLSAGLLGVTFPDPDRVRHGDLSSTDHLFYLGGKGKVEGDRLKTGIIATLTLLALIAAAVAHGLIVVRGGTRKGLALAAALSAAVVLGGYLLSTTEIFQRLGGFKASMRVSDSTGSGNFDLGLHFGLSFWITVGALGVSLLPLIAQQTVGRRPIHPPGEIGRDSKTRVRGSPRSSALLLAAITAVIGLGVGGWLLLSGKGKRVEQSARIGDDQRERDYEAAEMLLRSGNLDAADRALSRLLGTADEPRVRDDLRQLAEERRRVDAERPRRETPEREATARRAEAEQARQDERKHREAAEEAARRAAANEGQREARERAAREAASTPTSLTDLERLVRDEPRNAAAHHNLAIEYRNVKRWADAEAESRKAIDLGLETAEAWQGLGIALERLGRNAESASAFEKAVDRAPGDAILLNNLSVAYANQQRWHDAVRVLEKATRLDAENVKYAMDLGTAYAGARRFDEAERLFRRAAALDPRSAKVFYNWGNSFFDQEKWDAAIEKLQKAVELDATLAAAWDNLGLALSRRSRWADAQAAFRHAVEADPTYSGSRLNLGLVLLEEGKVSEAKQQYDELLRLDPKLAAQLKGEIDRHR